VVLGIIVITSLVVWTMFNRVLADFPWAVLLFGLFYIFVILLAGAQHLGRGSLQPANR
jgi:phosphoglycerol transferase MdoB-like AlkP superfamily enzyme